MSRVPGAPEFVPRLALGLAAATFALAGCRAQRELVISTDPPGAEIRVDGELQESRTPAHIPFTSYGVRRITLYLDGYVTYSEAFDVEAPWYAYFPIDVFSEILFPFGWRDRHRLRVKLVPGTEPIRAPDLLPVLQRAEAMRRAGPEGLRRQVRDARGLPSEDAGATPASESPPHPKPQGGTPR